jgi:fibronectin type III domain protein
MRRFQVRPVGGLSAPQVQGLVATATVATQVSLTWAPVFGALYYTVRRFGVTIANLVMVANYTDTGLPFSTLESYTVSAVTTVGEGLPSAPVFVMTLGSGGGGGAFDFYISPTGSNANPGTQTSPWAITALNALGSVYAGKRVGLLPGTYNIAALMIQNQDPPALNVNGGTAGSPTVIQATTPQGAILSAQGMSNNATCAMIGQGLGAANSGYVTFDGLSIQYFSLFGLMIGNHNNANVNKSGIVIQNCEFTNGSALASTVASGINICPITLFNTVGALVQNNWIHDNKGWTDTSHFSAVYCWACQGTTFQFNSIANSGGLHGKEAGNQGTTIQYNYIDWSQGPLGQNGSCIMGFDGGPTTGLTQPSLIAYNVLVFNYQCIDAQNELGTTGWLTPLSIIANTMVSTVAITGNYIDWFEQTAGSRLLTAYNNIFAGPAPGGYGFWLTNSDAFSLCDYNGYGTTFRANTVGGGGHNSAGAVAVTTLPAWASVIGGKEAHSGQFTASFIGPLTGPSGYQLTPNSPGYYNSAFPARLGGVSTGAATTMGAWDGLTTTIGASFAIPETGTSPPGQVVGVTIAVISSTQINLAWPAVAGATAYNVRMFGSLVPAGTGIAATSFNATGLTPGTNYSFTVSALNTVGEGVQSAPVFGTTPSSGIVPESFWFNDLSFTNLTLQPRDLYVISGQSPAGGGWIDIVGTDGVTGFIEPRYAAGPWAPSPNGAVQTDSIQIIAQNPLISMTATIRTDRAGPAGSLEPCLEFVFVSPYSDTVGAISGNTEQLSYMVFPNTGIAQSMTYQRFWYFLQADLSSRNPSFFGVSEAKTNSSERHSLIIVKENSGTFAGNLVWQLSHNSAPSSGGFQDYYDVFLSPTSANFPRGQLAPAPIPVGQWFEIEFAHNMIPGQAGWVWLAINGVQVFYDLNAVWNNKLGEPLQRIFPFQAYSDLSRSSSSPFTMRIGGGAHGAKFATSWPADATTHPNIT